MKKIKTDTPVETGQTFETGQSFNLNDRPQIRTVGIKEITYEKVIELEKQVAIINKKLDEILGKE